MIALIEANRLGQLRTGAVTGLAAKFLADPAATKVGLFGSGWQAQSQLAAIVAVRPIKQALVYSRDEAHRRQFAEQMAAELNIEVIPVDQPRGAVADLPIVITATASRQPVFDGQWLAGGALVCAVGSNWLEKAEIDVTTIRRAERIVCDSVAACRHEAGDFTAAIHQGLFDWSQAIDLAEVVDAKTAARRSPHGIVLFKSVGMALEDIALGSKLLELARKKQLGQTLPL
jgi:ornithine cyclodeaminase/alanine dehydrogenase-like protein (mu-crystallin family)